MIKRSHMVPGVTGLAVVAARVRAELTVVINCKR
jgi:precorrin-4 methylase